VVERPFWLESILAALRKRPIVWLAGVRRVGKTTLARMVPDTVYLNCDLPSVERRLEDPEAFYRGLAADSVVVLDEVHRLEDPSRALKIAADAFPRLRVLATGSSTLAATRKFRDALTGRKTALLLMPVLWMECEDAFGIRDLDRRLLHGGLPEALLEPQRDDTFFAEWIDSFYARDIQELFRIRGRSAFLDLFRLLLRQSGGLVDYTALARSCEVSRPTVKAYVDAMAVACSLYLLRPFHGGGRRELVRRPKAYVFDTGLVCYGRGWRDIRDEDRGILWEHLVLDVLRAAIGDEGLFYWRDKSDREVDFVVRRGRDVHVVECKINPDRLDPEPLAEFRRLYPRGRNYVASPGVGDAYERGAAGDLRVRVVECRDLLRELATGR